MTTLYQYDLLNPDFSFKKTISPNIVRNEIVFTGTINAWQWSMKLDLTLPYNDTTFEINDVMRISVFNDFDKSGRVVYNWFIEEVIRNYENWESTISLELIWSYNILQRFIYSFAWSLTFERTWEPATLLQELVDFLNLEYWNNIFSLDADTFWSDVSYKADVSNIYDIIKLICNETWYYFYVDANNTIFFKPIPSTSTHRVKQDYDIDKIRSKSYWWDIVNSVYLQINYGRTDPYTVENTIVTLDASTGNVDQWWPLQSAIWDRWLSWLWIAVDTAGTFNYWTNTWTLTLDVWDYVFWDGEKRVKIDISEWETITSRWIVKNLSDASSIAQYWERQRKVSQDWVTQSGWRLPLSQITTNTLDRFKIPIKETSIVLNNRFDYYSIKPWDTIKVLNSEIELDNVQILKVSYKRDKCTLTLDRYQSLSSVIDKETNILLWTIN